MSVRAVFLDRDGVVNEAIVRRGQPHAPRNVGELEIAETTPGALGRLKQAGFLLIVVTNQPDVSRGTHARAAVEEVNAALLARLPLDEILVCWHDDANGCDCRKPKPGLLEQAARRHGIDLPNSFMIGDRWRDIDAGVAAGCRTVMIEHHYRGDRQPDNEPDFRTASLVSAVEWIVRQSGR